MIRRLIVFSVVSANLGYTAFLYPVLSMLYGDRVPLTLPNFAAFVLIDTLGGVVLALVAYLAMRVGRIGVTRSVTLSVALLWAAYWLITICLGRSTDIHNGLIVIFLDGVAAFITWASLIVLIKLQRPSEA